MKREHKKKLNTYREYRSTYGELPLREATIEDMTLIEDGNYGETKCDWLVLFFSDKSHVRIPVIKGYRMGIRMRTEAQLKELHEREQ